MTIEEVAQKHDAAETMLQLTMDEALRRLPEQQRRAIRLRIEGYEVAEITQQIQRSLRSTERLLQEARTRLGEIFAPDLESS